MQALRIGVIVVAGVVLSSTPAFAQGQVVAPQAGCTATPAQLEAWRNRGLLAKSLEAVASLLEAQV